MDAAQQAAMQALHAAAELMIRAGLALADNDGALVVFSLRELASIQQYHRGQGWAFSEMETLAAPLPYSSHEEV